MHQLLVGDIFLYNQDLLDMKYHSFLFYGSILETCYHSERVVV